VRRVLIAGERGGIHARTVFQALESPFYTSS